MLARFLAMPLWQVALLFFSGLGLMIFGSYIASGGPLYLAYIVAYAGFALMYAAFMVIFFGRLCPAVMRYLANVRARLR